MSEVRSQIPSMEEASDSPPGLEPKLVGVNMNAMIDVVAAILPKDEAIASVCVHAQGSYNKIFLVRSLHNEYIVRIPWPRTHTAERLLAEVATLIFVHAHRNLPVPHVYAWSSTSDNPTGAPYIVMEKLSGVHRFVHEWFLTTSWERRLKFLEESAHIHTELARPLPFTEIGSIYLRDPTISRFSDIKDVQNIHQTFKIGPLVMSQKLVCTHASEASWVESPSPQLPASTILSTWKTVIKDEYTAAYQRWGRRECDEPIVSAQEVERWGNRSGERGLSDFVDVFTDLNSIISGFKPTRADLALGLWHEDLALRNILVDEQDDCKIVGVLDWEDCHVLPLSLCARYPEELSDTGGWFVFPDDVTTVQRVKDSRWDEFERSEEVDTTYLRWYYRGQVAQLDPRFNAQFWRDSERTLKIHSLVMGSWKSWLINGPLIEKMATQAAIQKYTQSDGMTETNDDGISSHGSNSMSSVATSE